MHITVATASIEKGRCGERQRPKKFRQDNFLRGDKELRDPSTCFRSSPRGRLRNPDRFRRRPSPGNVDVERLLIVLQERN